MFQITKTIDFCCGHRLSKHKGKCRNLHGHNCAVEVSIRSGELDAGGMVLDFSELEAKIRGWIDKNLDHRMLLNKSDKLARVLKKCGQPCFLMDGEPTAENIARAIYNGIKKAGVKAEEVIVWETPRSSASYGEKTDG